MWLWVVAMGTSFGLCLGCCFVVGLFFGLLVVVVVVFLMLVLVFGMLECAGVLEVAEGFGGACLHLDNCLHGFRAR